MKKLFIVVAALFAMSAFAADPATDTKPADAGMAKDAGAMSKDTTTTTTKKEHKKLTLAKWIRKKLKNQLMLQLQAAKLSNLSSLKI